MVSLNSIMVRNDSFHASLAQMELACSVDSVQLLRCPEVVAELSAFWFTVMLASGTFVDDRVCLSTCNPVGLAMGREVERALVGEAFGVELAAAADVVVALRHHEVTVNE